MRLSDLIEGIDVRSLSGDASTEITGLTKDSRDVRPGYLFFATGKSLPYVEEVRARGAAAIVAETGVFEGFRASVTVPDVKKAIGRLAARFYGFPSRALTVVGITGTNGKTTITYLIESMLREAGRSAGVIGTISYRFGGRETASPNTTPGAVELQALLADMARAGTEAVVMEVSSHALDQSRIEGVDFDAAILTNVTHDHLDYHSDFESYKSAKVALFRSFLEGSAKDKRFAVLNLDDPHHTDFIPSAPVRTLYYSLVNRADACLIGHREDLSGLSLDLSAMGKTFSVRSSMVGMFNAANILAATLYGCAAGLSVAEIQAGVSRLQGVPGRMERVPSDDGRAVFIDYAHTPDALRKVLETLGRLKTGKLVVVFGCGGDRDRAKRPAMGRIASEFSSETIITSDNPRSEDPSGIIREIAAGIPSPHYRVVEDRRQAIFEAIAGAGPGDVVLIAGKGHEDYQIVGADVHHFSDRETAGEALGVAH